MSPENTNVVGYNAEVPPPVVEQAEAPKLPTPPPFRVYNRSRADKLARKLYGINGRVWINRSALSSSGAFSGNEVWVGTERGSSKSVFGTGKDFSAAFRTAVETYVKGAGNYDDTKIRLREMSLYADVSEFVHPSLGQFDEYKAELNKTAENFKKLLEKGRKQAEAQK